MDFYILRVQREEFSLHRVDAECQIKFFPILHGKTGEPLITSAEDPDDALRAAIKRFPTFRGYLAVQDCASYNAIVGRLIAEKLARIRAPEYPRIKPQRVLRQPPVIQSRTITESPERKREPERVEAISASSFFGLG